MERQRFCVYNQTCECFLSLGVAVADTMPGRLKELIARPSASRDEGLWVVPSKGRHTVNLRMAHPIDLVYLDRRYRVIRVVESSSKLLIAPLRSLEASVLAMPAHTIHWSQTQRGNQLVICVAETLEFRLKSAAGGELSHALCQVEEAGKHTQQIATPGVLKIEDRRKAPRRLDPRLIAYDWNGVNLAVHGIRDASATGLYLLTEKRWPLGTLVVMTLQRPSVVDTSSGPAIAVELEVVRCGQDGVGLQFVSPGALEPARWIESEHVKNGVRDGCGVLG
jgi:uncharacterized membrane protein (UPF0127 family)